MSEWRLLVGVAAAVAGVAGALATGFVPDRSAEAVVLDGAAVFRARGCATCHTGPDVTSLANAGPPLLNVADWADRRRPGRSARAYLAESMRTPGVFRSPAADSLLDMPDLDLTDDEIDALVEYLLAG